jgi:hypothetical protein
MSVLVKVLIFAGAILAFGALGLIIYNQINISKQQTAIQQQVIQQKTLVDGLVQSSNRYTTTADLNSFIQQNTNDLKAIQANLSSLGAKISAANVVTSNSNGQSSINLPSTNTGGTTNPNPVVGTTVNCPSGGSVTCPVNDPYGYQQKQQTLAVNETFGSLVVPFSNVSFSAWQQAPWAVSTYPRQYSVASVIGTDTNQRIYVDNKFTVTVNGKNYNLPINAQTQQVYPSAKLNWWAPQLFLSVDGGLSLNKFPAIQGELTPSLNFAFINYGKYKYQSDWSFAQIGAGYGTVSHKVMFNITPVAYNLGNVLPLIHNTFIAPSIQLDTSGTVYGMLGLRLGF